MRLRRFSINIVLMIFNVCPTAVYCLSATKLASKDQAHFSAYLHWRIKVSLILSPHFPSLVLIPHRKGGKC